MLEPFGLLILYYMDKFRETFSPKILRQFIVFYTDKLSMKPSMTSSENVNLSRKQSVYSQKDYHKSIKVINW